MFRVLVESELRDICSRFVEPYEVAVHFNKSHCPECTQVSLNPRVQLILPDTEHQSDKIPDTSKSTT